MLEPILQKNDKQAKLLIGVFSVVVFVAVSFLTKFTITVELPFDKHIFALLNALLNTAVAFLLVAALVAVKQKKYAVHKNIMLTAFVFSSIWDNPILPTSLVVSFKIPIISHLVKNTNNGTLNK